MLATRTRRSDRFLRAVADTPVTIVTHDNPDPDAIAAGWALVVLLRETHGQTARLMGRGAIVRPENVYMMRILNPPLELVDDLPTDDREAALVLVDCVPTGTNQPVDTRRTSVAAVIDHHTPYGAGYRALHRDVRPRAAATAAIAASYLREQQIEPATELATALLYAIRTELIGGHTRVTRADRGILAWLSGLADHGKLTEIEGAPLSRAYFSDLVLGLLNVFIYDDAAICFLPQASGVELVGAVADLVIRCEGVSKALCGAFIGDDLILSTRTSGAGGDATALLATALRDLGHCGGHEHRAGGKIAGCAQAAGATASLRHTLEERWLSACKVDPQRGSRLVRRQDVLERWQAVHDPRRDDTGAC
jgi:nanoRNase/pAp phosphatase (c-di-AMP/oligoRNAs hydrolase)